ncbi:MAG: PD-(D/E)XK nuclease family protein [Bacillota bacterium]|nr:PD-(D/E)XK nuclease family protein [Bacillota bacterium]
MPSTAAEPSAALRDLRSRRGLSVAALATRAGIPAPTIRAWESGRRRPSANALLRVAEVLAVDPREILPTPAWRLGRLSEEISDDEEQTWSPSKLGDWLRCPAYFRFRHVDQLPAVTDTVESVLGRAVHRAAEIALRAISPNAAASDAGAPLESPGAAMAAEIQAGLDEMAGASAASGPDEEEVGAAPPDPTALIDEAAALHGLWQAEVLPRIGRPIAIEVRTEIRVAGVRMTVIPDVIAEGWVRDLKTTRRKPAQADLDENLQATAESLAYRELTGETERGVAFDYLVRTKKPYALTLETSRGPKDHDRLARIVAAAADSVAAGRYWPNPQNKFGCARCPYREICRDAY